MSYLAAKSAPTSIPEFSIHRAAAVQISGIGSIGENTSGKQYAYRCSKTALNMATKNLSVDLREAGVLTTVVHPCPATGVVANTRQICGTMLETLDTLSAKSHGSFIRYDACPVAW